MTTAPSALPQWKGRPVPWVTRWTHEISNDMATLSLGPEGLFVHYQDGYENREPLGILWKREGLGRGGEPEYAQVNAYRQRLCMKRRRCQVCGNAINSVVIRWLMAPEQLETTPDGRTVTISPPTCEDCIPLALQLCPHLKKAHVIVRVLEYQSWGVMGSIVGILDGKAHEKRNARVEYVKADEYPFPMACVIARQQVVEFTKFVVEKSSSPNTPREETLAQ